MLHLHTERLAALADEAPTKEETEHLTACEVCAGEVSAYKRLLALTMQTREIPALPLVGWSAIAEPLHREGLVVRTRRGGGWEAWTRRAVAAGLLLAIGAGVGRYTLRQEQPASVASAPGTVPTVATPVSSAGTPVFTSVAQARAALAAHARGYQDAAEYLSANDSATGSPAPDAVRSRLAALDEVAARAHDALREAPYDAVINRSYLTTQTAREATIRQLGAALPVGYRLARY
ncbi:MAG: hypothetical protein NVS1B4_17030 [Gemmatimonadaceae bacterium]